MQLLQILDFTADAADASPTPLAPSVPLAAPGAPSSSSTTTSTTAAPVTSIVVASTAPDVSSPPTVALSTAASAALPPAAPKLIGPHMFPKGEEGATAFYHFLMDTYPARWQTVYNAPLLDSKRKLLWAPKYSKEMAWDRMCTKLVSWYWANDNALQKAPKDKFANLFWRRYTEDIHPRIGGVKPQLILEKMYHLSKLVINELFFA